MNYEKLWEVYKFDSNLNFIPNLTGFSKPFSDEIVIAANLLDYGDFKFVFKIIGTFNGSPKQVKNYSRETYIRIKPTGLAVYGLQNGVSSVTIGSKQSLNFFPIKFSFDFDSIASIQNLTFDFYCRKLSNNLLNISDNYRQDLKQYPILSNNLNCFNSTSKLIK